MIKVKIELIPFGFGTPKTLGSATIINNGKGDTNTGNYDIIMTHEEDEPIGSCEIEEWPRLERTAWDLLHEAIHVLIEGKEREEK